MTNAIEHLATPDEHSDLVGGSTAGQRLGCPGSYRLEQQLKASLEAQACELERQSDELMDRAVAGGDGADVALDEAKELREGAKRMRASYNSSSEWADEGTALHEVMAYLVMEGVEMNDLINDPKVDELFAKYKVDEQRFFDAVVPAYREFNKLLDEVMDEDPDFEVMIRVEARCEMPGIDNAFGTTDILIRGGKRTVVWDWKFGVGVPVAASYTVLHNTTVATQQDGTDVEEVTYGNDQLSFYARAAQHTYPDYFPDDPNWPVQLVICQPRIGDGTPSTYTSSYQELEDFRLDLIEAVELAQTGDAPLKIGKYCRFAKCKAICPLHLRGAPAMVALSDKLGQLRERPALTGEILEAEELVVLNLRGTDTLDYAQALNSILHLANILGPLVKEGEAQAQAFLEAGGELADFQLYPKRAGNRSWEDEDKADAFLGRQGLAVEDRRVVKPITPAVAETRLKAAGKFDEKGKKLFEKYVKQGVSSGYNVGLKDGVTAPALTTASAMKALAAKIGGQ